jgi:hypothetical protein
MLSCQNFRAQTPPRDFADSFQKPLFATAHTHSEILNLLCEYNSGDACKRNVSIFERFYVYFLLMSILGTNIRLHGGGANSPLATTTQRVSVCTALLRSAVHTPNSCTDTFKPRPGCYHTSEHRMELVLKHQKCTCSDARLKSRFRIPGN